jgi:hypothetical protein
MRRCGRASCLVLVGLFAAATAAGGAYPAAGGHQGKGHAWAKGKAKNQAATPQLSSSSATVTVQAKPSARVEIAAAAVTSKPKASPPGAVARHNHVTICHRTGSGYIVISPDVKGVMNGHFKHHDDLVYVDGCPGRPAGREPNQAPQPGAKAPDEGSGVATETESAQAPEDLPFTGLPALGFILGGALLAFAGLALRSGRPRVDRLFVLFSPKSRN